MRLRLNMRARRSLRLVVSGTASPYPKASLLLRGMARLIDVVLAWGLYIAAGDAGAPVALLYVLLADGVLQGQSVGKRIFGVKAVHLPTGQAVRYRDSVLRNAPLGFILVIGMMPAPLGGIALVAGAAVIGGLEAYQVVRHPLGMRFGDTWAETQVVDGKVVNGLKAVPPSTDPARAHAQLRREQHR